MRLKARTRCMKYMATAAAGQVAATREEEAASRLDNLLVRPVGRGRWLAGRLSSICWATPTGLCPNR